MDLKEGVVFSNPIESQKRVWFVEPAVGIHELDADPLHENDVVAVLHVFAAHDDFAERFFGFINQIQNQRWILGAHNGPQCGITDPDKVKTALAVVVAHLETQVLTHFENVVKEERFHEIGV